MAIRDKIIAGLLEWSSSNQGEKLAMDRFKPILRQWLPLAVVVTAVCGLVYLAVQQDLRQSANDPQIQMAEDAAAVLENGAAVDANVPVEKAAIEHSLAPFLMVFNDRGEVVGSSAMLHG
jgi:hypothetical protein